MYNRTGVGAYPTDAYFDRTRPAWLPYWVDTPTENAQKWGLYPGADINAVYPAPPMPVTPAPPVDLPANPLDAASAAAAVQAVIDDRARRQTQATGEFFAQVNDLLDERDRKAADTSWWVLAGVGVAVLFLLKR